jgi:hypothetical protein
MNEFLYVLPAQDQNGNIWLLKQVGETWQPHRQIKQFIEGDDLIIKEELKEVVS